MSLGETKLRCTYAQAYPSHPSIHLTDNRHNMLWLLFNCRLTERIRIHKVRLLYTYFKKKKNYCVLVGRIINPFVVYAFLNKRNRLPPFFERKILLFRFGSFTNSLATDLLALHWFLILFSR